MPVISIRDLIDIIISLKNWIIKVLDEKKERRSETFDALEEVLLGVKNTTFYFNKIRKPYGRRSKKTELHLAKLWTKLSIKVSKLCLEKLYKLCKSLSDYWTNPSAYGFDVNKKDLKKDEEIKKSLDEIEKIIDILLLNLTKKKKNKKKKQD